MEDFMYRKVKSHCFQYPLPIQKYKCLPTLHTAFHGTVNTNTISPLLFSLQPGKTMEKAVHPLEHSEKHVCINIRKELA
jgi:hypothetical protein